MTVAQRPVERSRPATHPARRAPLAIRAFVGLLAVGAAMFNAALMLSDRAPGVVQAIFGDFAVRLATRLNGAERIDALTEGRTPGNDAIVHIGVWAVATVLVGLALWRWVSLIIGAIAMFAASIFIEVGQGRYTSSRAVELSDVAANGLGVALGTLAAAICYVAWSAAAGLASALRRR